MISLFLRIIRSFSRLKVIFIDVGRTAMTTIFTVGFVKDSFKQRQLDWIDIAHLLRLSKPFGALEYFVARGVMRS